MGDGRIDWGITEIFPLEHFCILDRRKREGIRLDVPYVVFD